MSLVNEKEINLIKNNEKLDLTDLEWTDRFYQYLQDDIKLSKKKAFSVIYYLQEHLSVFPDDIEQCSVCGNLYDTYRSGYHSVTNEKFYCSGCDHLAPELKNS